MEFSTKSILFLFFFALAGMSYGEAKEGGYFPPNNHGNYINISYDANVMPDDNSGGVINIYSSFTFNKIKESPRGTKFVATQFDLLKLLGGDVGVMYIGVNPTQLSQGYPGQAHFSYFGKDGVGKSDTCSKGADAEEGVTCAIDLPTHEGYTYKLNAKIISGGQYHIVVAGTVEVSDGDGKIIDNKEIGTIEVAQGAAYFKNMISWVEGTDDPCDQVSTTDITFYPLHVVGVYEAKKYDLPFGDPVDNACGVRTWPAPDGIGTTMEYPASQ